LLRSRLELLSPELKSVWGDVEENIPITIPQKDPQPAGLKLTLLPFQQESLHWMKKQEKGVWAGGMLAVSYCETETAFSTLIFWFFLGRNGVRIDQISAHLMAYLGPLEWAKLSKLSLCWFLTVNHPT